MSILAIYLGMFFAVFTAVECVKVSSLNPRFQKFIGESDFFSVEHSVPITQWVWALGWPVLAAVLGTWLAFILIHQSARLFGKAISLFVSTLAKVIAVYIPRGVTMLRDKAKERTKKRVVKHTAFDLCACCLEEEDDWKPSDFSKGAKNA